MFHPRAQVTTRLELHVGDVVEMTFLSPLVLAPHVKSHWCNFLAERGELDVGDEADNFCPFYLFIQLQAIFRSRLFVKQIATCLFLIVFRAEVWE